MIVLVERLFVADLFHQGLTTWLRMSIVKELGSPGCLLLPCRYPELAIPDLVSQLKFSVDAIDEAMRLNADYFEA